ncbi:hypothetical protein GGD83_002769 [Rhodoblastus sphagnicola]|uniref:hypothetical protein n=1 Tax=Rhodoblastus sphagnicola TaxID=333368 RepID=UPI0011B0BBD7|nr:hypothetical protein [Rhodoblastus sphagnicola]MBB4198958.1 hypothetical protein [Rhodoblastus sphagnicola]
MNKPNDDKYIHRNQLIGAFAANARGRIARYMNPLDLKLGATIGEAGGLLNCVRLLSVRRR